MTMTGKAIEYLRSGRDFAVAAAFVALSLFAGAGTLGAHVALDAPNGGEMLSPGSMVTISWHDVIQHGAANYDLWYSISGAAGPWESIAADLRFADDSVPYSYEWTVPNTPSEHVSIRVRQDHDGANDYEDTCDGEFKIGSTTTLNTVVLEPSGDATLYQGDGSLANGSGSYLFVGGTNDGLERRALLRFDLEGAIPPASTITEVLLKVTMSKTISGDQTIEIFRVLESWSEGPSDPGGQEGGGATSTAGDVTWIHRDFPNSEWASPGGSFSAVASSSQIIGANGAYEFPSTSALVADVQTWLDDQASNAGWAMVMLSPPAGSAKRFNSRENGTPSARPSLTISFEPAVETLTADFTFSPTEAMEGTVVSFSDASTGSPTTWSWDFNDGTTSNEQNPNHSFSAAGSYAVSLTASKSGDSDTTTKTVTILPMEEPQLGERYFVPAAANAAGAGGSFFITTLDVFNGGSAKAFFRLLWLPRGTDNAQPDESPLFTLEPGEVRRFTNLLDEAFGASNAVGAVALISDSVDIQAESRTFNQTASGTFGQSIPGLAPGDFIPAGTRARILFMTENDDFRTNLGLLNGGDTPITVNWEIFGSDGSSLKTDSVALGAWTNLQLNRVLRSFAPIEAAYAEIWTETSGGVFSCYGSVLDNISSDPTTILPRFD